MKKALSTILTCASLLLPFSSSAFAEKGYADTKETSVFSPIFKGIEHHKRNWNLLD